MRYSYEYKQKCIEMYKQGIWPDTPDNIKLKYFHNTIREWVRIEDICGLEALKHKNFNKIWTPEEKLKLVSQVVAGKSLREVAFISGISNGKLYQWVRRYKIEGYQGLVNHKRGRPSKEPKMKKKTDPSPLIESEREKSSSGSEQKMRVYQNRK